MPVWTSITGRSTWRRRFLCLVALFQLATVAMAAGYPRLAAVPKSWELDFEAGELRMYFDQGTGDVFWYFTYVVTNHTGADRIWAPQFSLMTDTGEIMDSGRDVPPYITNQIMNLLRNDLLEQQNQIIGDIRQGIENARDGLVIWPARSLGVNEMTLFISGVSGESARVINPATGETKVLRKTLQRDYLIPGSAAARGTKPVDLVSQRWILR
jgi:hypothetical protein